MLDAFEGHSWLEVVVWEFRKPLEFRQKLMKYSDDTWLCELQNKLGHFCKAIQKFCRWQMVQPNVQRKRNGKKLMKKLSLGLDIENCFYLEIRFRQLFKIGANFSLFRFCLLFKNWFSQTQLQFKWNSNFF